MIFPIRQRRRFNQGFIHVAVFAIIILQVNLCRSINNCCPGTELEDDKATCVSGAKARIDCPNGMWLLNPKKDTTNFTLVEEELELADNLTISHVAANQ